MYKTPQCWQIIEMEIYVKVSSKQCITYRINLSLNSCLEFRWIKTHHVQNICEVPLVNTRLDESGVDFNQTYFTYYVGLEGMLSSRHASVPSRGFLSLHYALLTTDTWYPVGTAWYTSAVVVRFVWLVFTVTCNVNYLSSYAVLVLVLLRLSVAWFYAYSQWYRHWYRDNNVASSLLEEQHGQYV